MRVLLLEDDERIRSPLARFLREEGYAVDEAGDATTAQTLVGLYPFDVMIADIRLPEGPDAGFELVKRIRKDDYSFPILFLSARDGLQDKLHGLQLGGDDYLVKPFHLQEVTARIRAILRRGKTLTPQETLYQDLKFDWANRRFFTGSEEVPLTGKEMGLLELLSSNPGRLYTREEIVDRVWDSSFDAETNVIDVYVRNLRRKLGDSVIETVRGVGYRFPTA